MQILGGYDGIYEGWLLLEMGGGGSLNSTCYSVIDHFNNNSDHRKPPNSLKIN